MVDARDQLKQPGCLDDPYYFDAGSPITVLGSCFMHILQKKCCGLGPGLVF